MLNEGSHALPPPPGDQSPEASAAGQQIPSKGEHRSKTAVQAASGRVSVAEQHPQPAAAAALSCPPPALVDSELRLDIAGESVTQPSHELITTQAPNETANPSSAGATPGMSSADDAFQWAEPPSSLEASIQWCNTPTKASGMRAPEPRFNLSTKASGPRAHELSSTAAATAAAPEPLELDKLGGHCAVCQCTCCSVLAGDD